MNNKNKIYILKYMTYILLLFFFYVLQTTPHLFEIQGIKPNLVIPIVICIAMLEGEFISGLFGALGGMLCDLSAFSAFGFYAILLLIACTVTGLLVIYLMKNTLTNAVVLSTAALLTIFLLDFFFMFGLWGYEGNSRILLTQTLPCVIYSALTAPLFYLLFSKLFAAFEERVKT